MSYGFDMSFIQCTSKINAYETARKFAEKCYEHAEEIIKDEEFYIPSTQPGYESADKYIKERLNDYWLYAIFTINFVYWPKYRLLGITGRFPKPVSDLVNTTVYFQNSCDQDYDFEDWNGIKLFEDMVKIFEKAAPGFLKNAGYCEYNTVEEIANNIEYERQSAMYQWVFNNLNLDHWLYNRDEPTKDMVVFSMNALSSYDRAMRAGVALKKILYDKKLRRKAHDYLFVIAESKLGKYVKWPDYTRYKITNDDTIYERGMRLTIYENDSYKNEVEHIIVNLDDFVENSYDFYL